MQHVLVLDHKTEHRALFRHECAKRGVRLTERDNELMPGNLEALLQDVDACVLNIARDRPADRKLVEAITEMKLGRPTGLGVLALCSEALGAQGRKKIEDHGIRTAYDW